MRLGRHLNIIATKAFAGVASVLMALTLLSEASGRRFWDRPLTPSEMALVALSIPGVWLAAFTIQWMLELLDERGL